MKDSKISWRKTNCQYSGQAKNKTVPIAPSFPFLRLQTDTPRLKAHPFSIPESESNPPPSNLEKDFPLHLLKGVGAREIVVSMSLFTKGSLPCPVSDALFPGCRLAQVALLWHLTRPNGKCPVSKQMVLMFFRCFLEFLLWSERCRRNLLWFWEFE